MPGAEDHSPIDGTVMEGPAAMRAGLVEREYLALAAKESDSLLPDVDGYRASHRGYRRSRRPGQPSLGPQRAEARSLSNASSVSSGHPSFGGSPFSDRWKSDPPV